jgi:hypothetical protein
MEETATNGMAGIHVPKANFINKVSRKPKKKSIKILVVYQLSANKTSEGSTLGLWPEYRNAILGAFG